jgi:hypothetical protein
MGEEDQEEADPAEQAWQDTKSIKPKAGNCVICSEPAKFCIRGLRENSYCRDCAEDLFQLEDLDRLD